MLIRWVLDDNLGMIFLISPLKVYFGYSLELPQLDNSQE